MKRPESEITGKLRRLSARLWNPKTPGDKMKRLRASLTEEEDWDSDQPQIRMSRAFAVMLVLHLVAVGGLFAFHVFGKDDQNAEHQATRLAHANSTPPPAPAPVATPTPEVSKAAAVPRAGLLTEGVVPENAPVESRVHLMKPGETKLLVAAKYAITVKELEDANPGHEIKAGAHINIPAQGPRTIGALADAKQNITTPTDIVPATNDELPGHREFALKEGAENPYKRDESLVDHEPAPAARATPVMAKPSVKSAEKTVSKTKEKATVKATPKPAPRAAPADDDDDDGEKAPKKQVVAKSKPVPASSAGSRTHVVQKGDTVYNVARRYGLSSNEVMRVNDITDAGKLQMGQVLKITVRR